MKRWKKLVSSLIVFLLVFSSTSLTAFGEEMKNAVEKEVTMILNEENKPKELKEGKLSENPGDYPLVKEYTKVGTLYDYWGTWHEITYQSISEGTPEVMQFQLYYESNEPYDKDRLITTEFYEDLGGTLSFLGAAELDMGGFTEAQLGIDIDKGLFNSQKYIYVKLGVSDYHDSYYSDVTLFKVENPFYSEDDNEDSESYILISNESTNGDDLQYSGTFKVNNKKYANSKVLNQGAYKLDITIPFNVSENKKRLVKKSQKQRSASYQLGDNRNFWVTSFITDQDYQINGKLLYSGTKANVWVHNNQISAEDAAKLGAEFDSKIHPTVVNHFADESDVDGDGKINILCFDIEDGFNGSGGYIAGYFYARDLYDMSYSNKSEIFYIDTYPLINYAGDTNVASAYETLAHEFQHMVNFNQNVLIEGSDSGMDVWLDEGLAMAAEQIYTNQVLSDRVAYYNQANSITNGHSLLYWDYNGDTLSNYSLSYLFAQYFKVHAGQGNAIFRELLQDPNNDYKAIEKLVKKYIDPSMTFGQFMTNFRAALLLNENTGMYGFKGDAVGVDLQEKLYRGSALSLRGGGAVVKKTDSTSKPADGDPDITYTFLSRGGAEPVDTIPPGIPSVNSVSDKDTVVTGIAEANSTIYVTKGDTTLGTGTALESGAFNVKIAKQAAGTKLSIYAEDTSKNKSETVTVTVQDKTAPSKPTVNELSDKDTAITGSAEANSIVHVKKGNTALGSGIATSKGSFNIKIAKQAAGTKLSIYAEDTSKNKSETVTVTVLDKTAPSKPTVNQVSDKDTDVKGKAEKNTTVYVKKGNTFLGKATVSNTGSFNVKITNQKAGTRLIAYVQDKAGNKSSDVTITVVDKTPPDKPTVYTIGDNQTKVLGKATANSKIVVKAGKKILGTSTASKNGTFTVNIKKKQKAGTTLMVYAVDKAGNDSAAKTVKVKDKTAPKTPTVNKITSKSKVVTGKAEKGATVYVYKGKKYLGKAVVNKKGKFTVKIKKQKKGSKLTVYAQDKAKNKSKTKTVKVK